MFCLQRSLALAQKTLRVPANASTTETVAVSHSAAGVHGRTAQTQTGPCGSNGSTTDITHIHVFSMPSAELVSPGPRYDPGSPLYKVPLSKPEEREGGGLSEVHTTTSADPKQICDSSRMIVLPGSGDTPPRWTLTQEQVIVCDLASQGASLFIGGEAGTGKSYLLRVIADRLTKEGRRVAITASTGIAALNIGGNTFHSIFGVHVPTADEQINLSKKKISTDDSYEIQYDFRSGLEGDAAVEQDSMDFHPAEVSSVKHRRMQRLRFTNINAFADVDVVIIDEVSMLHAGVLESLERATRRAAGRDVSLPFGGLQMILSGDFLQLTPFAAVNAPVSRRKSHTYPDEGNKTYREDVDCVVCERVTPENDDRQCCPVAEGSPQPLKLISSTLAAVDAVPQATCVPTDRETRRRRGCSSSDFTATQRRHSELWYYDKFMFDSWCFKHHLLHVQLREPQRQQEHTFSAALNELRQGRLPYRLSRSAFLNAPVGNAVRLLPTKAAVKNFNDHKMLELDGEEKLFRTHLSITEATSSSPLGRAPGGKGVEAGGEGTGEATLLVHYRLCSPSRGDGPALKCRGRLRHVEAISLARNLEGVCSLPHSSVHVYGLPTPLSFSTSLSTVCISCSGATQRVANDRRWALGNLLEKSRFVSCKGNGEAPVEDTKSRCALGRMTTKPLPAGALLFPREIVRVEAVDARQLVRRIAPFMQEKFRDAIRKDTVLQDKRLKVGCRVMLLRNLSCQYVNGSLGTVVGFRSYSACTDLLPEEMKVPPTPAKLLTGVAAMPTGNSQESADDAVQIPVVRMDADGKDVAIPWVTLPVPVAAHDWSFLLRVACVPLTPAYAFTVHKVQGITLDHDVLFDAQGMFPCDHLVYVAASRVRKFKHLRIVNLSPQMISVHRPSLLFAQKIPSVGAAHRAWEAWKVKPRAGQLFYFPSHIHRGKT